MVERNYHTFQVWYRGECICGFYQKKCGFIWNCCLQKIWEKPKGHLLPEFLEKECPFLIFFDFIYLIRAFTRNIPSIINVVNGQFRSQSGRLCKISPDQNNDGRSLCNRIWNLSGALIFWWGWSISTAMKSSGILQGILQGIFQGMPFGTFCRSYIDGKKTQRYNKKEFTVFSLLKWRERMKYKGMRKKWQPNTNSETFFQRS